MDLRQISAQNPVESRTYIKCWRITLLAFDPRLWQWCQFSIHSDCQIANRRFEFIITCGDLGFVEVVELK